MLHERRTSAIFRWSYSNIRIARHELHIAIISPQQSPQKTNIEQISYNIKHVLDYADGR